MSNFSRKRLWGGIAFGLVIGVIGAVGVILLFFGSAFLMFFWT